ncbi:unnamed protein product [Lactuca virosa]|uniref:Uncharacterized protein n=1 Tax=Lactuca virosa TaxID=75947 RepID=A0AAU9PFJ1_9ASTR|nr:unnamed protein product [Lactuca virosa]
MSSASLIYASALGGSLSRSTTPEPQIVARLTNPRIPAAGGRVNSAPSEHSDLAAGMSLSTNGLTNQENEIDDQNTHIKHPYLTNKVSRLHMQRSWRRQPSITFQWLKLWTIRLRPRSLLRVFLEKENEKDASVKGKSRLGTIVHQKTATAMCLTTVKNEDKMEFSRILEAIKVTLANQRVSEYLYTQMMQETGGQQSMVDESG